MEQASIVLHITSLLDPSIKIHLDRKIYEHGMKESSIIYLSEQDKVISGYIEQLSVQSPPMKVSSPTTGLPTRASSEKCTPPLQTTLMITNILILQLN